MATIHFSDQYKAKRALPSIVRRPDMNWWVAKITGTDKIYGLARAFLPKTWPQRYEKRATPAYDCGNVQPGDVLQLRGNESRSTQIEQFWRVVAITDDCLTYEELTDDQLKELYHQGKEK